MAFKAYALDLISDFILGKPADKNLNLYNKARFHHSKN